MTTYRVTAVTGFEEHQLGDVFDADLDPELEERALERGQLEKAKPGDKKPEEGKDA